MSEILFILQNFSDTIEHLFKTLYNTLRFNSPLGFLTFYLYLFIFLYLLKRYFEKQTILYFKITDESEPSEVLRVVKKKNQEIIENLEKFSSSTNEKDESSFSKALLRTSSELNDVKSMYSEFRDEILDSHNSIRDSLRVPTMK